MTAELFDERGPEANNRRAAEFESQLEAMAHTLGWSYVCRNVDVVIKPAGRNPSRGVDLLCALENPQTGDRDGILSEAKVHGSQAPLSELQKELQTLHDKMSDFSSRQAFLNNEDIRASIDGLRWGLLAHRTSPGDRVAARHTLRSVKLKSLHKAAHVTTIVFAGPDTLEALADCVSLRVDDAPLAPTEFYWPAHEDANGVWARCCPPHQLAEGMVAFRTVDGRTVLWIRDTLVVKDMNLIKDIVFQLAGRGRRRGVLRAVARCVGVAA